MNELPTAPRVWSRGRWLKWIAVAFLGQVCLLFWLSEAWTPPGQASLDPPGFRLVLDPEQATRLALDPYLADPGLFVFAQPAGFSGSAWLESAPPGYRLEPWKPEPLWLPPDEGQLGLANLEKLRGRETRDLSAPDKPEPALSVPSVPQPSFSHGTIRMVEGLEGRMLESPPAPSPLETRQPLQASRVEVLVGSSGVVLTARSGWESDLRPPDQEKADQKALEWASRMRFSVIAEGPPQAGLLEFRWGAPGVEGKSGPPSAAP